MTSKILVNKEKMSEVLSMVFLLTIIVMETFIGKNSILDVMYTACGITGLAMWFKKDNLGLIMISISLSISAYMGNVVDELLLIINIIILFIRMFKASRKNEKALMETTNFKEAKWYVRLLVVNLYVVFICNSYLRNTDGKYTLLSLIWAYSPLVLYTFLLLRDLVMVEISFSIMALLNIYINYMMYKVNGLWFGIVEMVMISFIVYSAAKSIGNNRSK